MSTHNLSKLDTTRCSLDELNGFGQVSNSRTNVECDPFAPSPAHDEQCPPVDPEDFEDEHANHNPSDCGECEDHALRMQERIYSYVPAEVQEDIYDRD